MRIPSPIWKGVILFIALGLLGCAAKQAVSDGDEARKRGDTYAAANHYLDALDEEADHGDALKKIGEVAKRAYDKKLKLAESNQEKGNLEEALREYKELEEYLNRLREHNALDFTPVNAGERIRTVSTEIAKKRYRRAEALFEDKQYKQAIRQYENALEHRESYKDAVRKIAASYYRMATRTFEAQRYREAAETYLKALREGGGYEDARQRAATLYYHLGNHFLTEGHCRQAYEDFDEAGSVVSGFEDVDKKLADAKKCATVQVAFADLRNTTGRTLAGMNLGNVIFQKTRTKLQKESSQFIEILTRQQLAVLMEEHGMSTGAVTNASSIPRSFEGADYVVFGTLNQVQAKDSGPEKEQKRTTYEYATQETYVNNEGETKTRTEWHEAYAYYTLNTASRTVRINGSIQVVDASSRSIAINKTVDHEAQDVVRYATNVKANHNLGGDNTRLDSDFVELVRARKELKSVNELVQPRLDAIATSLSHQTRKKIDRPPSVADPSTLDVSFQAVAEGEE